MLEWVDGPDQYRVSLRDEKQATKDVPDWKVDEDFRGKAWRERDDAAQVVRWRIHKFLEIVGGSCLVEELITIFGGEFDACLRLGQLPQVSFKRWLAQDGVVKLTRMDKRHVAESGRRPSGVAS